MNSAPNRPTTRPTTPTPGSTASRLLVVATLLLATGACTHRQTLTPHSPEASYREASAAMADREAEILTRSGEILRWHDVRFRPDSTSGTLRATGLEGTGPSLATERIARVTVKSRSRGAWEGLGIGAAAGALLSALSGPGDCGGDFVCPQDRAQAAAFGAVGGALWGILIGAIRGSRTQVEVSGGPGGP